MDDGILSSKSHAKDKCSELGIIFVEHFHMLYNDKSSQNARRLISVMQQCYDYVSNITLRYNNKKLSKERLLSWFFYSSECPMEHNEYESYNKLVDYICYGMKVKDAFYKLL